MLPLVTISSRLLIRRSTSSLVIRQGSRGTRLDTPSCRRWLGTSSSPTGEQDLSGFELRQYGKDDPPRLTCKKCSHILYENPKVSTSVNGRGGNLGRTEDLQSQFPAPFQHGHAPKRTRTHFHLYPSLLPSLPSPRSSPAPSPPTLAPKPGSPSSSSAAGPSPLEKVF